MQLFLLRMGVGVGEAGSSTPSYSMISDYLPPAQRARGLAAVPMGATLGLGLGMIVGGYVAEIYDWRAAFLVAGVPGMVLAVIFQSHREGARPGSQRAGQGVSLERPPFFETARYLLGSRTYRLILFAKVVLLFSSLGRSLWEPGFIIRIYEMGEASRRHLVLPHQPRAFGLRGLPGGLAGRSPRPARQPLVPVGAGAGTGGRDPAAGRPSCSGPRAIGSSGIPVAFVLSFFGSIFGAFFIAPFTAAIQGIARVRMRAVAIALMTVLTTTLVGMGAGPVLVGMLSDAMSLRASGRNRSATRCSSRPPYRP